MSGIKELLKIKLELNQKIPLKGRSWQTPNNQIKNIPDLKKYNYGILTGKINNIIVVDLDLNKDDEPEEKSGLNEFDLYLDTHDNPDTYTVRSRKGGLHFYFKYSHSDPDTNYKIETYLKNTTGLRGANIDIRTNGGYIVGAGSSIDGAFYTVANDTDIKEIPDSLVNWLLEGGDQQKEITNYVANKVLNISDDEIKNILNLLDKEFTGDESYFVNYSKWLMFLTVMKNLNKYDIFEEYSKKSNKKYDQKKNLDMWNANKGIYDINYLINVLNNKGHKIPYANEKFQSIQHICSERTDDLPDAKTFNKMYVSDGVGFDDFNSSETLIIQSCTGTGKTTAVSQHTKQVFQDNKDIKFISIVDKRSLASQHVKSFKDIEMKNYMNVENNELLDSRAITICINSLLRLEQIDDFSDYIIYIDEITSFLKNLTENKDLDFALKKIFILLNRIIKTAYKVIVSDAIINDAVFIFLLRRPLQTKKFFINKYKKFEGVEAIMIDSEYLFLLKLEEHTENLKPFLFACDSKTKVEEFYIHCLNKAKPEDKEKFILITATSKFEIIDANEQFKNKFVFYSPSIVYGVDFNTLDARQDVFLYVKGKSLTPDLSYQQLTRTRSIEKVFIFCNARDVEPKFKTFDDYYNDTKQNTELISEKVFNLCTYIDQNENLKFVENSFFFLYNYHQYIRDQYKSRLTEHLIDILEINGFKITKSKCTPTFLNKEIRDEMKENVKEVNEDLYNKFIGATLKERKENKEFEHLQNNLEFLSLEFETNEIINTYKEIITSPSEIETHLNVIRLLKSDDYIKMKLNRNSTNCYAVKNVNNSYTKIELIRQLEKSQNLKPFEPLTKDDIEIIPISEKLLKTIKIAFRKKEDLKIDNVDEYKKLYVTLIKNVTCPQIVKSTKGTTRKDKSKTKYSLDEEKIKFHIGLDSYNNELMNGYNLDVMQTLKIEKPVYNELSNDPFDE